MCDDLNWQLINPLPADSPRDSREGLEKKHGVS